MQPSSRRIVLPLPEYLVRAGKMLAAARGQKLSQLISGLLEEELKSYLPTYTRDLERQISKGN